MKSQHIDWSFGTRNFLESYRNLKNGVGVLIDTSLKDGVVEVRMQGDRIILVKIVISAMVLNVISAYAPQIGHDESAKRLF